MGGNANIIYNHPPSVWHRKSIYKIDYIKYSLAAEGTKGSKNTHSFLNGQTTAFYQSACWLTFARGKQLFPGFAAVNCRLPWEIWLNQTHKNHWAAKDTWKGTKGGNWNSYMLNIQKATYHFFLGVRFLHITPNLILSMAKYDFCLTPHF